MKTREYTVVVTEDDVRFLRLMLEHYRLFAEASERQGETRSAGIFRKQEFYAERFLLRIEGEKP